MFWSIESLWASVKCILHKTCGSASSAPTYYVSVELLVFKFYFLEKLTISPLPRDMPYPLWHLKSMWVLSDASTHHLIIDNLSTERVNFVCLVPFRYLRTRLSLPQSSSSGNLNYLVRKSTDNWMSLLYLPDIKGSYSVMGWKIYDCSSSNLFALSSSLTWNNHSADGEATNSPISSGKYLSTLSRYLIIYNLNLPSSE